MDNPNADPHGFEVSPSVAREVARARLVVQNGAGYDDFMRVVEAATPSPRRRVVVAQRVLGLAASIPNPHLWYDPATMPAVAAAIEADLARVDPAHRAYFAARLARFDAAMAALRARVAAFAARFAGRRVATTEPVGDYLLSALGLVNDTPFRVQADVMNGVDPAPQDVGTVESLLTGRRVAALLVNAQVSSPVTTTLTGLARGAHVPVVALYETMPRGFTYQRWMTAEIDAIERALTTGRSTRRLT
jgi:zinc/manganese transport system substrate-binding protein